MVSLISTGTSFDAESEAKKEILSPLHGELSSTQLVLPRGHSTLRVTPAMEAGISDHVWSLEEMCALLAESPSAAKRIDKGLILKALGEKVS